MSKRRRETYTRAPAVAFEPNARPPEPVRANFPGEEPPQGLHVDDLGPASEGEPNIRLALLGEPFDDPVAPGSVRCLACAHRCVLRPSRVGICGVRQNRGGWLYTLVYGQVVASKAEPIEKKPIYHFLPGSDAYSIATRGCNFHCDFCQNWQMAQADREGIVPESRFVPPEAVVERAVAAGVRSIAYTYVEPTVFLEFALDTMARARAAGLHNVFVTNGYQTPEALEMLAPVLDAANVDLKGFRDGFYRRVCGARLDPVKETLVAMRRLGIWIEVTTLVIPDENDGERELTEAAEWIAGELGPDTPWHLSRFYPAYRMSDVPVTPLRTLRQAAAIGRRAGLRHVYVGNVPGEGETDTRCPACGHLLIGRAGYRVARRELLGGACANCGTPLAGIALDEVA